MYRYLFIKKVPVILYAILAPASALCSVVTAAAMAAAVDYGTHGELDQIWIYALFFGGYILLDFLVDTAARLVRHRLVEQVMTALLSDVHHKIIRLPAAVFARRNTADYIANLTADMDVLRGSYFAVLLELYMTMIRLAAATGVLFWTNGLLGAFVLANVLLQTAVPLLFAKRLELAGRRYSDAQERHLVAMKESLAAFLTAKTFHIEDRMSARYAAAMGAAEACRRRTNALKAVSSNVSFIFSGTTHLGVFLFGGALTLAGVLSTAQVVAASQLIVYISSPIYTLNANLADLRTARISAQKLRELLDQPEDLGGDERPARPGGALEVRDLSFSYGQRAVLSHVSWTFQPGGKYLLTGASGGGKSTLLSLLAGLRGDYRGSITLGGTEMRQLCRESVSGSVCVMTQEPFVFDDTLYNNVALCAPMEEERVVRALEEAGLGAFLAALPEGLRTRVGENAAGMSGGERQRLVVARARARRTPVLLLDEATSHLDPDTAGGIERTVLGLEGVTVVLVAHNATEEAERLADAVLELRDGRIGLRG